VIDGFEFASAGATQQGSLPISEFRRLRDLLATDAGEVRYEVHGQRDARGRPALRVGVQGTLQLKCQRCLEALAFAVDESELLVLAAAQDEIDAQPADVEAPDMVVASDEMAVRDLVEDQLILALPYAPRHEGCEAGAAGEEGGRTSPFAGLRGMLHKN